MCLFFVFLLFCCKKRLSSSLLPFWLFLLLRFCFVCLCLILFLFLYLLILHICAFVFVFLLFFCKKRLSSSLLPFWLFPLAEVTPSVSHYVELPSQHFFVKHTDIIIFIVINRTRLGLAFVRHVFWTYGTQT